MIRKRNNRILVLYAGAISQNIKDLMKAGEELGSKIRFLNIINFIFDGKVEKNKILYFDEKEGQYELIDFNKFDVVFFRTIKNHYEDVDFIIEQLPKRVKVVDSIVRSGKPTNICKFYQMRKLKEAGLKIPKTLSGSLKFLRDEGIKKFEYPIILKGSRGDRRTQVFKMYSDEGWPKRWDTLIESEKMGQKYMLQEYLPNSEDYRVMVIGEKAIGVMKRAVGENELLKNVFNKCELPDRVLKLAVRAAKTCGIEIAGVDVVFRNGESEPTFWEVNKTPNYKRFVEVTKVDVAMEIIKFLKRI